MREGLDALDTASNVAWNNSGGSSGVQGVAHSANTFLDKTPLLIKALDRVVRMHPFAGGEQSDCLQWRNRALIGYALG